ncbi:hypothetical protein ACFV23_43620, partial [Streptomyces sp. NPDC059627]
MATGRTPAEFTAALRARERLVGYWARGETPQRAPPPGPRAAHTTPHYTPHPRSAAHTREV